MSTVDLNMFSPDNMQESQAIHNNPIEELDVPEIFQYSKEKYKSQKMVCDWQKKASTDTSSIHAESKRLIHIQSEQKLHAEIKDSFEKLRKQLPITYTGRKMSQAVLLQKAVSHLENQSRKEFFLLLEINRLTQTCANLCKELENEK
ncbi:17850_t:CDS:2, partial [Cetraspora pellucida]